MSDRGLRTPDKLRAGLLSPSAHLRSTTPNSETSGKSNVSVRPWTAQPSRISGNATSKDALRSKSGVDHSRHRDSDDLALRSVQLSNILQDSRSWAVTELPEDLSNEEPEPIKELPFARKKTPLPLNPPQKNSFKKTDAFEAWVRGPEENSDEYDTDLEDDFPPEEVIINDPTGADVYKKQCDKAGVLPSTYLMRNLKEPQLRLNYLYLKGQGAKALADGLKKNTVTEALDLTDNYLGGSGAMYLCNMMRDNQFIVNLNLSENFLRSEGANAIAQMLETNTTLKTLVLRSNHLSDGDAKCLAEGLKNNTSLECLDLSYNDFCDVGGQYLGAGLAVNEGLIEIDLSWNSIREKGAVAVGKALSTNGTLEILDLSWNGFGVKGAIHLMRALKVNNKLRVLDLSNNRINNEGAKKLGLGVAKNMSVETLLLGMNPIGEEGMEALLKGINKNEKLKLVGIEDITLTSGVFKKIQELEAERDIILMHGGVGGFEKSRVIGSVIQVFDRFINDNALRLEDLFVQLDKDKSGDVTLEEMKYGLKNAGLCLTSKLIDVLLQMIDNDGNGTIEYSELLNGSALVEKERRRAVFKRSDIKN